MRYFTFLRHGRTKADDEQKYESRYDCELTSVGHKQISQLLEDWMDEKERTYEIIVTSTLKRAKDTAVMISNIYNIPVVESELLLEIDAGALCGMDKAEGMRKYPPPEHSTSYS
jgi:2,3-bisphosphoglycerate-dependent phosphoglycerate mutase